MSFTNLKGKIVESKPPLIKWIDGLKQEDVPFLEFILHTKQNRGTSI